MILANKHIVAIDDTPAILNFLRIALEALGARFSGAVTASSGVALCLKDPPDLIVLDLGLPDKEGFDILPQLEYLDARKKTPVIVLTVRNSQDDRETAAALGAAAYLTKPFEMSALLEIICMKLKIDMPAYTPGYGHLTSSEFPYDASATSKH